MRQNAVRPFGFRLKKRWFFTGLFLCLLMLTRCIRLHKTDREIEKYFKDAPVKPRFHTYVQDGWPIHYAEIGADSLPTVVFIHGAPGSWDAFIGFFKDTTLYTKARLVSVDRPGYGKSDYGTPETSLWQQAALLAPVLRTNRNPKKPVLVGHSLGGPVAARLAMDYPNLTGGLVLVAASVDPGQEKNEWYRHVGEWALVRKLLPTEFDVSNREILPLKDELTKMLPLWKKIRVPVTVIHGDADVLVPFANAAFSKKMLVHAPVEMVMLPKVNHFIPWSHPQVIRQAVLQQLKLEVRKQ